MLAEVPGAARAASVGLMGLATTAAALLPIGGELAPYGVTGLGGIAGVLAWNVMQEKRERLADKERQRMLDEKRIESDKARAEADKEAARAQAQGNEVMRALAEAVRENTAAVRSHEANR